MDIGPFLIYNFDLTKKRFWSKLKLNHKTITKYLIAKTVN